MELKKQMKNATMETLRAMMVVQPHVKMNAAIHAILIIAMPMSATAGKYAIGEYATGYATLVMTPVMTLVGEPAKNKLYFR
jgi:hypothetical protein